MNNQTIDDYKKQIDQFPLLDEKTEKDLQLKASKNDKDAAQKLYNHNLKLVFSIANQMTDYSNLDLMELIKNGESGLKKAIQKYHKYHHASIKPSSYYIWWIKSSILVFILKNIFENYINCATQQKDQGNLDNYAAHFFLLSFLKNTISNLNAKDLKTITEQALIETISLEQVGKNNASKSFIIKSPYFTKLLRNIETTN